MISFWLKKFQIIATNIAIMTAILAHKTSLIPEGLPIIFTRSDAVPTLIAAPTRTTETNLVNSLATIELFDSKVQNLFQKYAFTKTTKKDVVLNTINGSPTAIPVSAISQFTIVSSRRPFRHPTVPNFTSWIIMGTLGLINIPSKNNITENDVSNVII